MGVGGRSIGYLVGCPTPTPTDRSDPMPEQFDSHNAVAAFDHDSTLVVALELSGKSWQAGAVVPGVARRPGRRVKTDRIDLDMLLRTFLAWLRGEPRVCSMVRIPSEAEEEMRRPGRERERLVGERIQLENRIENLLCLHGVADFRPRLKKAAERLDELRSFAGAPLTAQTMAELRRLMARHRLLSEQFREIEAERDRVARVAHPDGAERMIQHLAQIVGLGLETATLLVREMFCRPFRDRRA